MTGQDLLDRMEMLSRELELQSGESDVARGLLALNIAQDHFESLGVARNAFHGSHTGTVTTTADTESTAWPAGLIRLDSLWFVNPDTSRPTYQLELLEDSGGHTPRLPTLAHALQTAAMTTGTGPPRGYFTDQTSIYWYPLPNATHTVRWYGVQRQSDITAVGTFAYDDGVALPLAAFAVELLRRGLDDDVADYDALARDTFKTALDALSRTSRERAPSRQMRYTHDT